VILDRNRVAQLEALASAERTLTGPERAMREAEVATLIKASFDDATDTARAEFMAKVKPLPVANWPWSAVRAGTPRAAANYKFEPNVLGKAPPPKQMSGPPLLILIMGQAATTESSAGNEIPDRTSAAGQAWAPLYAALDSWNTDVIKAWIGPTGWMDPTGVASGDASGEASGPPADGVVDPAAVAVPSKWPSLPTWAPMAAAAAGIALATGITAVAIVRTSDARRLKQQLGVG